MISRVTNQERLLYLKPALAEGLIAVEITDYLLW